MLIGLVVIIGWIFAALVAPKFAPQSPNVQHLTERLSPPGTAHPLGTDELGRDILSRILYGARLSIPLGPVIVMLAAIVGMILGAAAGFLGRGVDEVVMRVSDAVLAFPPLILAMAITVALGPGLLNAVLAIASGLWPEYARLSRAQVVSARELDYVTAARAVGVSERHILWRHILPCTFPLLLVKASLDIGNAILITAALSFVGLGVVPPTPEWGSMVAEGRLRLFDWWIGSFPGLAIFTVVMGLIF
jgi:peptide/nickel transport system permease protein